MLYLLTLYIMDKMAEVAVTSVCVLQGFTVILYRKSPLYFPLDKISLIKVFFLKVTSLFILCEHVFAKRLLLFFFLVVFSHNQVKQMKWSLTRLVSGHLNSSKPSTSLTTSSSPMPILVTHRPLRQVLGRSLVNSLGRTNHTCVQ